MAQVLACACNKATAWGTVQITNLVCDTKMFGPTRSVAQCQPSDYGWQLSGASLLDEMAFATSCPMALLYADLGIVLQKTYSVQLNNTAKILI